jgi:hypothetical protein
LVQRARQITGGLPIATVEGRRVAAGRYADIAVRAIDCPGAEAYVRGRFGDVPSDAKPSGDADALWRLAIVPCPDQPRSSDDAEEANLYDDSVTLQRAPRPAGLSVHMVWLQDPEVKPAFYRYVYEDDSNTGLIAINGVWTTDGRFVAGSPLETEHGGCPHLYDEAVSVAEDLLLPAPVRGPFQSMVMLNCPAGTLD